MSQKTTERKYTDTYHVIGKKVDRVEDYRLLTGTAQYLDDLNFPRALHVTFVRSPHAHARILSIDTQKALEVPGVVAVFTGKDINQWAKPLRMAPPIEGLLPMEMTAMPTDKVRFDGDPVACVVAQDRYIAEDAAELVVVQYEEIKAVTDMFKVLQEETPLVDDALDTNLVSRQTYKQGDVEDSFAKADHIVEARFSQHRQTHVPIETRGCAAVWDEGRQHLKFYIGTQVPHPMRTQLAARLGLKETQVQVICPDIGGAFGQKIALYREELTVAAVAKALKRTIRWREDRMENLMTASHAREDYVKTRTAVTREGKILAMDAELVSDFGAYSFYPANYMLRVVAMLLPGVYKIENYKFDMKVVLTNKCPAGPMRAPMAIASWVTEGTMDAIARQLELDPIQVRQLNMIRQADLPYRTATDELYEDISPEECLNKALEVYDYPQFRKEQQEDRKKGRYRGLGLCQVIESTTYGTGFYRKAGIPGTGHEAAWIRIEPTGVINASVGLMGSGQGYETTVAQAAAEGLGAKVEDVSIHLGDTNLAPYGMGSRGSRGAAAGAGTVYLTALEAKKKVLKIAARLLNVQDAADVDMVESSIMKRNGKEWIPTDLTLADIAHTAYLNHTLLPDGLEPGLEFHKTYDPPAMTYSNAAHLCEVEVEIETGKIDILQYHIVEDAGTIINQQIVDGQLHGSTIMGLGGVMFEQVLYDDNGQFINGTFMDYLMPTASEAPNIDIHHIITPNRNTPAGIKGMSEGGVMGSIGSLCNAVSDALSPYGITIEKQPLTPSYIRALIREKMSVNHNCNTEENSDES